MKRSVKITCADAKERILELRNSDLLEIENRLTDALGRPRTLLAGNLLSDITIGELMFIALLAMRRHDSEIAGRYQAALERYRAEGSEKAHILAAVDALEDVLDASMAMVLASAIDDLISPDFTDEELAAIQKKAQRAETIMRALGPTRGRSAQPEVQ